MELLFTGKKCRFTPWLLLSLLLTVLFFSLGLTVKYTSLFDILNKSTLDFLIHHHTDCADIFFISATLLCQPPFYYPLLAALIIWFFWHRRLILALNFFIALYGTYYASPFFKKLFEITRPSANIVNYGYSYPSGHTLLAGTVLWFLSLLFTQHLTGKRKYGAIFFINLPAVLIAFSRLYLGVHWVTDIIGGSLLAWAISSLSFSIYRLYDARPIKPDRWFYALISVAFLSVIYLIHVNWDQQLHFYSYIANSLQ